MSELGDADIAGVEVAGVAESGPIAQPVRSVAPISAAAAIFVRRLQAGQIPIGKGFTPLTGDFTRVAGQITTEGWFWLLDGDFTRSGGRFWSWRWDQKWVRTRVTLGPDASSQRQAANQTLSVAGERSFFREEFLGNLGDKG